MLIKEIGIIFWIIALGAFIIGFSYMTSTVSSNAIGSLAETIFFGLIGVAFSISGTLIILKDVSPNILR